MSVTAILAAACLVLGTVFLLAAALGVLRFPDFYTRLHASGKGDTLGAGLVLLGLILTAGASLVSLKLALIVLFVFLFNPTATHALAHGAWVCGVRPWKKGDESFRQREGQLTHAERDAHIESWEEEPGEGGPEKAAGEEDAWTS